MLHHPLHSLQIDLAATMKARAKGKLRRKQITLKPIDPTASQAQDLAAIIVRVATLWKQAAPEILKQYDPPAAPGPKDSLFGLGDALDQWRQQADRLVATLTPALRQWALREEQWHRDKWAANVMTATGVQLDTLLTQGDAAEPIEAFVQRNVALVRDISDEAKGRISDIVFRNFQQRAPIADVAREVADAVDMSRRRAIRVAADQTQKLSAALDTERMQQAGLNKWQWMHSGKVHYRPQHLARNGHIYSFDNPPPDMPGQLPFCGCKKLGVLDLEDDGE